ncbi:MAG TPA: DUF748 domain-containing protein [Candidatus Binataceae bacterium]|nr:DUF748 domain-containing protein [Candidatus Binataceae bacterium]
MAAANTPRVQPTPHQRHLGRRIGYTFATLMVALIIGVFIVSFFLDDIIRPRIERAMNEKLVGYQTTLLHAHLQLLGGRLTLKGLKVVQQKHPTPPVANIDAMRFTIQWRELFSGHVVANVLLTRPKVRIDTAQFQSEKKAGVPMRQEGWQDALENVYPFKINKFAIRDGDINYVDASDPKRPLHVEHLYFTADNIRNLHYQANEYPSPIQVRAVVFDKGTLSVDGKANFLAQPYPGMRVAYKARNVPLHAVSPASSNVNLVVHGGVLSSVGWLEYAPKIAVVEVDDGTLDAVDVTYVHTPQTDLKEQENVTAAGKSIEKENNRAAVIIMVKQFEVRQSSFAYSDLEKNPNFKLTLTDSNIILTNYSNHEEQGPARVVLKGKFMGSGDTSLDGTFLAEQQGPHFDMNLAIKDTDMTSMNNLLLAYGRFDVKQGKFSVYSQLGVKNDDMSGYVKPMFSDLKVYDWQKDKSKPVLHQAYELAVGGASHIFKSSQTKQVATQVDLTGKLKNPNVSTWQAVVEILQNAFIQAILPGFDREAQLANNQKQ